MRRNVDAAALVVEAHGLGDLPDEGLLRVDGKLDLGQGGREPRGGRHEVRDERLEAVAQRPEDRLHFAGAHARLVALGERVPRLLALTPAVALGDPARERDVLGEPRAEAVEV